jgi:hypothetical protein
VFHLDGGLMLSMYPRSELAKDALVPLTAAKPGEIVPDTDFAVPLRDFVICLMVPDD